MARMASNVVPIRTPVPRYSPTIAAEGWMEIAEAARRLLSFAQGELGASWASGDLNRLRALQAVHGDASTILMQGRRHAGWADGCADGIAQPGHGVAA